MSTIQQTVYPPGWMYVFAFALRSVPWAVKELEKNEELRAEIERWRDPIATAWGEM